MTQATEPVFTAPCFDGPTEDEIKDALRDYAKTAARMPARSGMGWLNDQHSRIHERINLLLADLGL